MSVRLNTKPLMGRLKASWSVLIEYRCYLLVAGFNILNRAG